MNFRAYLVLLYDELSKLRVVTKSELFSRLADISGDYERGVKLMQLAEKAGRSNEVPYGLKYWF